MDYLKSLTGKQWLMILFAAAVVFGVYLFFRMSRKPAGPDLETLLRQTTAPPSAEQQGLNKSEINKLLQQTSAPAPVSSSGQPKSALTETQRDALRKLLSAPRR